MFTSFNESYNNAESDPEIKLFPIPKIISAIKKGTKEFESEKIKNPIKLKDEPKNIDFFLPIKSAVYPEGISKIAVANEYVACKIII